MQTQTLLEEFDRQLDWLYTLITDPHGRRYFVEKSRWTRLGELQASLDRMADFLAFAGRPQDRYHTIHVAGTSGKSTVTTILAALLSAAGLRTGHHVSPYLQLPNEKLIVNGQMISPGSFIELVGEFREVHCRWKQAGSGESLRYGEAWVALTYLFLAREQVDWGVIEVGVGGRYDPTNVIDPAVSVITNIDIDHVKTLGETTSEIAYHKAGIIKPGRPAVTASRNPLALAVIEGQAARAGAPLYRLGQEFDYQIDRSDPSGLVVTVQAPNRRYECLRLPLSGKFQAQNLACAMTALDVIAPQFGLQLGEEVIRSGLESLCFPGRMEVIQQQPLVILDGAHNPHKMRTLVASLRDAYPGKRFAAVLGMLAIKDAVAICQSLVPLVARFFVTAPDVLGKPPLPPAELAAALQQIAPRTPIEVIPRVHQAIEQALQSLAADDMLLITGSLYLLGEARDYWAPRRLLLEQLSR